MARFGFSGDLGNVDTLTGVGWSFEGTSKAGGRSKAISLSGDVTESGSFEGNFKARGSKVKGWLNFTDTQSEITDALEPNFTFQSKNYDFTPGDRIKIKLTRQGRFQVVDHDLSLEREQAPLVAPDLGNDVGDQGTTDPITGTGATGGNGQTSGQILSDLLQRLDANGDGQLNLQDLRLPITSSTLQSLQDRFGLDGDIVQSIAEQNNPIQNVVGPVIDSWVQTGTFQSPQLQQLFQPGGFTNPLPQLI